MAMKKTADETATEAAPVRFRFARPWYAAGDYRAGETHVLPAEIADSLAAEGMGEKV